MSEMRDPDEIDAELAGAADALGVERERLLEAVRLRVEDGDPNEVELLDTYGRRWHLDGRPGQRVLAPLDAE
jgi:hypothetical protein